MKKLAIFIMFSLSFSAFGAKDCFVPAGAKKSKNVILKMKCRRDGAKDSSKVVNIVEGYLCKMTYKKGGRMAQHVSLNLSLKNLDNSNDSIIISTDYGRFVRETNKNIRVKYTDSLDGMAMYTAKLLEFDKKTKWVKVKSSPLILSKYFKNDYFFTLKCE